MTNPKRPREYSGHLYSVIPIKQLAIETRSNEEAFGHLYPRLLRLLATHYPHLCLVEDWISEEEQLQVDSHAREAVKQRQLQVVTRNVAELTDSSMFYLSRLTYCFNIYLVLTNSLAWSAKNLVTLFLQREEYYILKRNMGRDIPKVGSGQFGQLL